MTHNAFFPDTEYTARLRSVREAMGQRDVDVLLITSPENIYYLTGLDHQGYFAFTMLIFPRDGDAQIVARAHEEVIMAEMVKLADATPIVLQTTPERNFCLTPSQIESAVTANTKAIIIGSPSNPTGTTYDTHSLRQIGELAVKNQFYLISDEIYEALLYDGVKHQSLASFGEEVKALTFVVNGVSKAYSMTGWRIGYTAGPEDAIKAMSKIQSHSTSNPTSIAQSAALAAISGLQEPVAEMLNAFQKRRDLICQRFDDINGVEYVKPQGAFYLFPDFSAHYGRTINRKTVNGSLDMAAYLLDDAKVGVIPGGDSGADNYLRLSFATSLKEINRGLDRIKSALEK